jgi:hypothetical protein
MKALEEKASFSNEGGRAGRKHKTPVCLFLGRFTQNYSTINTASLVSCLYIATEAVK